MTTSSLARRIGAAAVLGSILGTLSIPVTSPAAQAVSPAAVPGRLMLVMDASGSMAEPLPQGGGTKIAAARTALHRLTAALPDAQPTGLRVFGARQSKGSGAECTDSQRVVDPGTGNRPALDRAIDAVRPFGETPIGYALQQAAEDLGTTGQRTVVLVSDGEPTCAPDPCVVAADLAAAGVSLRVDVVGLAVAGSARAKLQCIAAQGEGRYFDADSADELAGALDQAAVRAAAPFTTSGRPVHGSDTRVSAPLVGGGDWTDTLGGVGGPRQTLYYRVHRTVADSTLHVSVASVAGTETDVVGLALLDSEGRSCASATDSVYSRRIDPIVNASVSIPRTLDASDLRCAAPGAFVVQVDHGFHNAVTVGRRADVPIELRVREEAPVRDVQALPALVDTPDWTDPEASGPTSRTAGASSLAGATLLRGGGYTGSITTGEVQAFAVDLDYGQSLAAAVRTSVPTTLAQTLSKGGWPTLAVRLLSPSRLDAAGGSAFRSDALDHVRGTGSVAPSSDGTVYYEYTDTIAYRNRFANAPDLRAASEAGRYLVVVSLLGDDASARRATVPFALNVGVRGAVAGAPRYATGTEGSAGTAGSTGRATAAPTAEPTPVPDGTSASRTRDGEAIGPLETVRRTAAVGAIAVGVVVLVAAGVLLLVLLLRRRPGRP